MNPLTRLLLSSSALLLAAFDATASQDPVAQESLEKPAPASNSYLELRISRVTELWFFLRSEARKTPEERAQIEGIDAAVAIVRDLDRRFASFLAWGFLEARLEGANDLDQLMARFQNLPENFRNLRGESVSLREAGAQMLKQLRRLEAPFSERMWPDRRTRLRKSMTELEREFLPRQRQAIAHMLKSLGMEDPKAAIPVYLATEIPFPGAVTYRRKEGGGICFVETTKLASSLLYETLLHESLHAFDVWNFGRPHALADLRSGMSAAGFGPRDRALRDVPHTAMFLQAAATVRAIWDPEHIDYGTALDYYAKVPQAMEALAPWQQYLRGELVREVAVQRIVEAAKAAYETPPRAEDSRGR